MELKLGIMKMNELADWFGLSTSTLSKAKAKYMKKLEEYCEFTQIYGGVKITKIHKKFYTKNKSYQIVRQEFCDTWSENGLDSCRRVASEIYSKHANEITVKEDTTYMHARQVRNELYGKPMIGQGEKGTCEYIWCKKENGKLVFLSPEEEEIKKKLLFKYFATANEKTVMVQTMIDNKELTKEEAWEYYSQIINLPAYYEIFLKDFRDQTGVQLIKGTLIHNELRFELQA